MLAIRLHKVSGRQGLSNYKDKSNMERYSKIFNYWNDDPEVCDDLNSTEPELLEAQTPYSSDTTCYIATHLHPKVSIS